MPRAAVAILALAALLALPAAAPARVLVVGDSLEVGTGPRLQAALPGAGLAIDARSGRRSGEGLRVLRAKLSPEDEVVVFDLGTNDPGARAFAANLAAAAREVGDRCLVLATLPQPALDAAVAELASRRPNTAVVDWRGTAEATPGLLVRDRIHATGRGYAVRARLIARAVRSCASTSQIPEALPAPEPVGPAPAPAPAPPPAPVDPATKPRPRPRPRPTGFELGPYLRFRSVLAALALGALLPPPPDFVVITA